MEHDKDGWNQDRHVPETVGMRRHARHPGDGGGTNEMKTMARHGIRGQEEARTDDRTNQRWFSLLWWMEWNRSTSDGMVLESCAPLPLLEVGVTDEEGVSGGGTGPTSGRDGSVRSKKRGVVRTHTTKHVLRRDVLSRCTCDVSCRGCEAKTWRERCMKMTWRREGTRERRTDPIGREKGETKPNGGWRRSRNTTGIKTSLADESKRIDERSK